VSGKGGSGGLLRSEHSAATLLEHMTPQGCHKKRVRRDNAIMTVLEEQARQRKQNPNLTSVLANARDGQDRISQLYRAETWMSKEDGKLSGLSDYQELMAMSIKDMDDDIHHMAMAEKMLFPTMKPSRNPSAIPAKLLNLYSDIGCGGIPGNEDNLSLQSNPISLHNLRAFGLRREIQKIKHVQLCLDMMHGSYDNASASLFSQG